MVPTLQLSSGHQMPLIGLGMWQTSGTETVNVAVRGAVQAGCRLFDTSPSYGNEADLGRCLSELILDGVVSRQELFIVDKLPTNGMRFENVEGFLRKSLKALRMNYLDLFLIHFPVPTKLTENEDNPFPVREDGDLDVDDVDLTDTWRAMELMVDKNLTKSIGLSNVNNEQLKRIYNSSRIKPANVQVECHAYLPQCELFELCEDLGVTMTAYAPLGTPGLPQFARLHYDVNFNPDVLLADEKLQPLAAKHKKSYAQILLRYLVQRGIAVIPKSSNLTRIKENMQIFDFELEEADMKTLKSMAKSFRYFRFDFYPRMVSHAEYPF